METPNEPISNGTQHLSELEPYINIFAGRPGEHYVDVRKRMESQDLPCDKIINAFTEWGQSHPEVEFVTVDIRDNDSYQVGIRLNRPFRESDHDLSSSLNPIRKMFNPCYCDIPYFDNPDIEIKGPSGALKVYGHSETPQQS